MVKLFEGCFSKLFFYTNTLLKTLFGVQANTWSKWEYRKGTAAPQSRKAHTAVIHEGSMFIYGGYQDMRGSLSEMWQFELGMSAITA